MGAALLLAGWVLLFNPDADGVHLGRGEWESVRDYDSQWRCEQGRREEAAQRLADEAKDAASKRPPTAGARRTGSGNLAVLLQYRCEHEERVRRRRSGSR